MECNISELREAMMIQLKDRLNRCALPLQDEKLIAKLSSGDVVAQELKCHPKCLAALYNRERKVLYDREFFEEKREEHTDELVFAELITHIVESQRANPCGVFFKLVDL
jgi:hypothetical protein